MMLLFGFMSIFSIVIYYEVDYKIFYYNHIMNYADLPTDSENLNEIIQIRNDYEKIMDSLQLVSKASLMMIMFVTILMGKLLV